MGMYDREPNFEDSFTVGDRFVVTGMQYAGQIKTRFGPAEKVLIELVSRDHPTRRVTYSAIGAGFANMAQRASASDFPHVAQFITVDLGQGRAVKRLARVDVEPRAFIDGEDGPPINMDEYTPAAVTGGGGDDSAALGF